MEKWQPYGDGVTRMKVPGGWLYRCYMAYGNKEEVVFGPEPEKPPYVDPATNTYLIETDNVIKLRM